MNARIHLMNGGTKEDVKVGKYDNTVKQFQAVKEIYEKAKTEGKKMCLAAVLPCGICDEGDELLPEDLEALIDNEIASGRGRMILKMNSLVDVRMTEKLYEASQAGVDIDLIIRGQCSLKPGIPGLSDRIRVRSIIGRYLEHSRIYHFANGDGPGEPVTYIGSADLMSRNLNRRVEALVRLDDPRTQQRVREILDVVLDDGRLAWTLAADGVWTKRRGPAAIDTHARLQQLARGRANG